MKLRLSTLSSAFACLLLILLVLPVNAGAQTAHFSYAQVTLGSGFAYPEGVTVDGNGKVFVADTNNGAVKEILAAGDYTTVNTLSSGFDRPDCVAVDGSGNVFVADPFGETVSEILAAGGYSTVNTLSNSFRFPRCLAADQYGNVFVSDISTSAVYEIIAAGGYTTVKTLGSGFNNPIGVAVDGSGNVFVADQANNAVKEILSAGGYTTVNSLGSGFNSPVDVAVDGSGNVFVSDASGYSLKEILAAGGYTTVNTLGDGFSDFYGLAVDRSGNIFLADTGNSSVVELETAGVNFGSVAIGQSSAVISLTFTFDGAGKLGSVPSVLTGGTAGSDFADAGTGICTTNGTSHNYGAGDSCTVDVTFTPKGVGARNGAVVLTGSGGNTIATAYIHGIGNGPLVAFGPGTITTFAGDYLPTQYPWGGYTGDGGPATSAQLASPHAVAFDGSGNLYIADAINNRVRMVTPGGIITTVAGSGVPGYNGDTGTATSVELDFPQGVAVDGTGNLYIADSNNFRVCKVTPGGVLTTIASGIGSWYVAVDGAGDIYISDAADNVVRMVAPSGIISTVAGNGTQGYSGDGGAATSAELYIPIGIRVDGYGNLYIADEHNNVVRKVTPGGVITTVAGNASAGIGYSGDGGSATSAQLQWPIDVAVDAAGNLYIADQQNWVIRKVTPGGVISTIAGDHAAGGGNTGDNGSPINAEIGNPVGLALDGLGNLYISEYGINVVRKVDLSDPPSLTFASTAPGSASAAQDVDVLNLGDAPLTISQISTAPYFSLAGADTSCSASAETLAPAASCVLGIEFNPTEGGSYSGSAVLTDNTLNASAATQNIAVQGTAPREATSITITAPTTDFSETVTLTASMSCATGASINGNVTFTLGNTTLGTAPVSGGVATLNVVVTAANGFTAGSNTVTASYAGDAQFAGSTSSTTMTVGAPSYTLTATPSALTVNAGNVATATLSLASTGYNGTVSLTAVVTSANGTASAVTANVGSPATLSAGGGVAFTFPITTTTSAANHVPVMPWKSGGAVLFCAVLLPLGLRRKRVVAVLLTALAFSLSGLMMSCGSSRAARVYTVTVTPTGTGIVTNPAPVSITVTVR